MHFSLRTKLLIAFISLDVLVSALLGLTMYTQSVEMFINDFKEHKLSLAQYISANISGDKHQEFKTLSSRNDPEYKKYYNLLKSILVNEYDIRYVYTLNYDSKKDELFYAIDTDSPPKDSIWVESSDLSFKFSEENGKLYFEHNEIQYYTETRLTDLDGRKIKIELSYLDGEKKLLIENQEVLQVISLDPLVVVTTNGKLDKDNRFQKVSVILDGLPYEFFLSYVEKNAPASDPGALFVEDFELKENMKKYIRTKTNIIDKQPRQNSYGFFLGAYSVIKNSKNEGVGLVVIDISQKRILEFKEKFTLVALSTSLIVFILVLIISLFLARYFTKPLELLSKAVETLAAGNLECYVEINTQDEFGKLAKSFNVMVNNLKIASNVQYNLLIEITQLNENLEKKVKERTQKIEEQSKEIDKQIQITRKIQLSLLPEAIPSIPNASVSFKYLPMMDVGGDFLDFDTREKEKLKLFICDVSGHGIPAAFLASMVKMALQDCYELNLSPTESLNRIHRVLKGKMQGHFLSAIFCEINLETGLLKVANAGHLPLIYVSKLGESKFFSPKGRVISELISPNFPEDSQYLNSGDKIVLYTDGITESRNPKNEMYGENRLLEVISKNFYLSTQELCEQIYKSLLEFRENENLQFTDDITILVAEYNKAKL